MECVVCQEQITNPISQERLQEQLNSWLKEVLPRLVKRMNIAPLFSYIPSEEDCVVSKNPIKVCPHCFWMQAKEALEGQKEEILEELERLFNYEIFPPLEMQQNGF